MSKNEFICDCNIIHQEIVDDTLSKMPEQNIFNKIAEFFKILGDTTRTKILFAYFNCSRSASIALRASKSQRSFSVWPAAEAQRYYPYGENVFQTGWQRHRLNVLPTGHYPCGDYIF